jgi:hypothetical protein
MHEKQKKHAQFVRLPVDIIKKLMSIKNLKQYLPEMKLF